MKLIIKKKPDAPEEALLPMHYDFYIEDGEYRMDIAHRLRDLELHLAVSDVNEVVLKMMLDDIDIDVDALLELKAVIEERNAAKLREEPEIIRVEDLPDNEPHPEDPHQ